MATVDEIKKLFPDYFTKNYRGQLNEDVIKKILKLYEEEKIGSNKIAERLLKENKLNINQGVIGRILTKARKNNIVRTIPKKELTSVTEQIVQGKDRKINNVVREITELDRKQRTNIPIDARYKIVFATPQGKTTKIPAEFIGVKYFNTKAEADTALNKRLTSDFLTPEDPNASKLKRQRTRSENVKAVTKGSSAADKENIKAIEGGITEINKYFKNSPELINTTPFGKNIKAMMSLRLDKETGNFYSKLRPDNYYLDKAKEGQLFDLFDINPVAGKKPGGRFATNVNISPNQFNRAFVGAQLSNFFNKGVNQETASQLDSILKERNIRVDLPNIGKVGASGADVAFDSTTGSFPRIIKTLETMEAPEEIKNLFRSVAELKPGSNSYKKICNLPLANGGGVAGCVERIAEDPIDAAAKLKKSLNNVESGPLLKVKESASGVLNFAKRGGKFGAFAAVGAGAAAIVKPFMNDDVSTYLSDEGQQKNMLKSMVLDPITQPDEKITEDEVNVFDKAYLPTLGAVTAAGAVPGGKRLFDVRKRMGAGNIRSALSPIKGVLGKGLAATGTPLGIAALEPLYIASQIAEGDSLGEIATNPLNYLAPAFMGGLSKEATRFASPLASKIMRLGASPAALKTFSRRFGLPGLALSSGVSAYEMFRNKREGRGLFDDG